VGRTLLPVLATGFPGTGFCSGGVVPRRAGPGFWLLLVPRQDHVRPDRTGPGRPGLDRLVLFVVVQRRFTPGSHP
jgi:hypothetical protein